MDFVNLNRHFVHIKKDEETDYSIGNFWGKRYGGWLDWNDLQKKRRVVLLAEALSGKTEEFKNASVRLKAEDKFAFFMRIEELADDDFENVLDHDSNTMFKDWKRGYEEAYFFLDSVDEARLNQKRFEVALKKLSKSIAQDLDRSHVYISSRVTDWKSDEDRKLIENYLPVPRRQSQVETSDKESALLDPIFSDRYRQEEKEEDHVEELGLEIIRLVPLGEDQQRTLANAFGLDGIEAFQKAIWQNGLEKWAEHPGELIGLIEYWQEFGRFSSLSKMTEHAIKIKLTEQDFHRPDNTHLSLERARQGVERIAAALTLGKTFTLRAPGHEPNADLTTGALDPAKILPGWSDAERNALLRRRIFAPSTYGRIRFHHRATQEYLTAQWIDKLLKGGCPHSEIFKVLFSDVYGVQTVVPSLKPVAAWLALKNDGIREEILKRDPIILIKHGDPGSLAIATRHKLMHAYVEKHSAGDIADDNIDNRALWMFAHPDLASTIRDVWEKSSNYDFRDDLLRLVHEGAITACADLVENVALDETANVHHRTVAIQGLIACDQKASLRQVTKQLLQKPENTNARIATSLARELFPQFLNVEQLITLIKKTQPPPKGFTEGFGSSLGNLWSKCPIKWKPKFISKIADLALTKPFVSDYYRISEKYRFLAKYLQPIARQLVSELGENEPTQGLIRILMIIERVDHTYSFSDGGPPLSTLVPKLSKLQRALFWADVEEACENKKEEKMLIRYWQIYFSRGGLWRFGESDLSWFFEDMADRPTIDDKRIALSAIFDILKSENKIEEEKESLIETIKSTPILLVDLEAYLNPEEKSKFERDFDLEQKKRKKERIKRDNKNMIAWRNFRDELVSNPLQISDPEKIFSTIHDLTNWLCNRTNQGFHSAPRQWQLIAEAFSLDVAKAYSEAMKSFWRTTKPERPRHKKNGGVTTKYTTVYAYAGVGIEADENTQWASRLSYDEAEQAAKHGCFSEQGYPDWFDSLLEANPDAVLPTLKKELRSEWKSKHEGSSGFLYRYANSSLPLNSQIALILFDEISQSEPHSLHRLDIGLQILQRIELSETQARRLKRVAIKRVEANISSSNIEFALRFLALLFLLDTQSALTQLQNLIEIKATDVATNLPIQVFDVLFNQRGGILSVDSLKNAKVDTLRDLILCAYRHIRPVDDNNRKGVHSANARDNAESGRYTVCFALTKKTGSDAYNTIKFLADQPEIDDQGHWFHELARRMAERDSESSKWNEDNTYAFEIWHIAPIKTGDDLYRAVVKVLDDIHHQLNSADASSKPLLSLLGKIEHDDEDSVQKWLAEQLILRSKDRFFVHREVEISNKNEPDIIISSATTLAELVIEVKQADSWSPNELQIALTDQLAERYLKPQTRRHGVLFLTDHGRRNWKDPTKRKANLSFENLLSVLTKTAEATTTNSTGEVQISVFGIDAK